MRFLTKVDLDLSCSCPYLWAFVFPFLFIWLHPGIVIYYTLDTSRHMRRSCLVLWADQIDQSTLVIRSIKPLRFGGRDLSPTHVSYVIRLTLDLSLFQQMAGNFAIFWTVQVWKLHRALRIQRLRSSEWCFLVAEIVTRNHVWTCLRSVGQGHCYFLFINSGFFCDSISVNTFLCEREALVNCKMK